MYQRKIFDQLSRELTSVRTQNSDPQLLSTAIPASMGATDRLRGKPVLWLRYGPKFRSMTSLDFPPSSPPFAIMIPTSSKKRQIVHRQAAELLFH